MRLWACPTTLADAVSCHASGERCAGVPTPRLSADWGASPGPTVRGTATASAGMLVSTYFAIANQFSWLQLHRRAGKETVSDYSLPLYLRVIAPGVPFS